MRTMAWMVAALLLLAAVAAIVMFSVSLSDTATMAGPLNALEIATISGESSAQSGTANVAAVISTVLITAGGAIAARKRNKA